MGSPSEKVQLSTVKPMLCRMGTQGSLGLQRVGESKLGAPRGEDGGVVVIGGRTGLTMFGVGERFCLGENEGREEGSYRSNELTREKTRVEDEETSLGTF